MTSRRISLGKRPAAEPVPEAAAPAAPPAPPAADQPVGKGRPTPKRREAQRRRGPVAPPPTTRKEAARRMRQEAAQERRLVREASVSGDQRRMLPRDAGPVRALVRDLVDTRRNAAVLMLPFALTLIVVQFVAPVEVVAVFYRAWTFVILLVLADLLLLALLVRRAVRQAFPDEARTRGHVGYALLRSTSFRRLRMPPPRVRPKGLLGR